MSEVQWIKLSTHMFEDEKIRLIESMPEADTLLIIWIKLLSQAGKTNASGYIYLSENIPYTEEMLATIFNRPINTIRLALDTFKRFGMIEINADQTISIANWGKHQNVEGLDKIREQNRLRKQRQRDKQKQLPDTSRDGHGTITHGHATDKEEDKEKEIDKELKDAPKHKKRVYEETSLEYQLASFFVQMIRRNNPDFKEPNMQKWSDVIRLMIEKDNRTEAQIRTLIEYVQTDDFEMANVLSPDKLRKRFDQLRIKWLQQNNKKPKGTKIERAQHDQQSYQKSGNNDWHNPADELGGDY